MRLKRLLFVLHRWFGIGMCLLFALWFATGIVMMYVEYPELTEAERLANLPPLDSQRILVPVELAVESLGLAATEIGGISMSAVGDRPTYLISDTHGAVRAVFADTGEAFSGASATRALAAVAASGFAHAGISPRYDAAIDMDQWTVSEVLDKHRPLHRVILGDDADTVLYVSSLTGQIIRDTNRSERLWNWLGSTIHWVYPMQLRQHRELWVNVIVFVSLAGIVSVVTGAVIGVMRLRVRRRYRGRFLSPYRGFAKWHHVLGLASLIFVSTYIFSGLMSVGPWGVFESELPAGPQIDRFAGGGTLDLRRFPALDPGSLAAGIKEVAWLQIGGAGHLVLSRSATDRRVTFGAHRDASQPPELANRVSQAVAAFLPHANVSSIQTLDAYDDYYYSRHNRYRPLPVYRIEFDDPESTWFFVDVATGAVVTRLTDSGRLERWLYNGMHSLDFSFLLNRGMAWDVLVIALSISGLIFSATSVVLGWRRLT